MTRKVWIWRVSINNCYSARELYRSQKSRGTYGIVVQLNAAIGVGAVEEDAAWLDTTEEVECMSPYYSRKCATLVRCEDGGTSSCTRSVNATRGARRSQTRLTLLHDLVDLAALDIVHIPFPPNWYLRRHFPVRRNTFSWSCTSCSIGLSEWASWVRGTINVLIHIRFVMASPAKVWLREARVLSQIGIKSLATSWSELRELMCPTNRRKCSATVTSNIYEITTSFPNSCCVEMEIIWIPGSEYFECICISNFHHLAWVAIFNAKNSRWRAIDNNVY